VASSGQCGNHGIRKSTISCRWKCLNCPHYRSISDEDGPKVADSFYEYLFRGVSSDSTRTHPDTLDAAKSLHLAVSKLRAEKGCSFKRWVPFIHMGL
jgi:hypothetical protein